MKIAIDARWIFPHISGIGAYTRELLRALAQRDPVNSYTVFFDRADVMNRTAREADLKAAANMALRVLPWGVFSVQSQLQLPGLLRRERFDVFHSPNYMIPFLAFPRFKEGRVRAVVNIHDVIPLLFPHHAPRSRKSRVFFLYRFLMNEVAKRADFMITGTEASRADCIRALGISQTRADRICTVPNGVSSRYVPPVEGPAPRKDPADHVTPRTCLYVGRADPYKNLACLIRAFAEAKARLPFPLQLVIAGPRDERYPEAPTLAEQLGVTASVTWTGYLSDNDLLRQYQAADLLALPSRCEGFGLPVIEAMACGTPCLCSTIPALLEIAKDAAVFANPDRVEEMAQGMQAVLTQPLLASRLARQGLVRAAGFTWLRTAEQTLAVYERAAALPGKPA